LICECSFYLLQHDDSAKGSGKGSEDNKET